MDRKHFDVPIVAFLRGPRTFHIIASVADAAEFLRDNWAANECETWMSAVNMCSLAIEDVAERESARSAFLDATDAAGIQVSAVAAT